MTTEQMKAMSLNKWAKIDDYAGVQRVPNGWNYIYPSGVVFVPEQPNSNQAIEIVDDEPVSIHDLIDICCEVFGVEQDDFLGESRKADLIKARYCYGFIAHKLLGFSSTKTAMAIKKDHSTILYYCKKFETDFNTVFDFSKSCKIVLKSINKTFGMSMSFEEVL